MFYIHKAKCISMGGYGCGLHFMVLSQHKDKGQFICPECGRTAAQFRWIESVEGPPPKLIVGSGNTAPSELTETQTTEFEIVPRPMDEEKYMGMETYLHMVRCLDCSLPFVVCSWDGVKDRLYCPDCGNFQNQLRQLEITDEFIFQLVPGQSELAKLDRASIEGENKVAAAHYEAMFNPSQQNLRKQKQLAALQPHHQAQREQQVNRIEQDFIRRIEASNNPIQAMQIRSELKALNQEGVSFDRLIDATEAVLGRAITLDTLKKEGEE